MPILDANTIIERKARVGYRRLGIELSFDIDRLERVWNESGDTVKEFAEFIPIRLVTFLETFIRDGVCNLIDSGSPIVERAEKLTKGAKIDFIFALNLHGQRFSIGDMVSHIIAINNPSQILSNFDVLIPNFTTLIRRSHPRWTEEIGKWPLPPIVEDFDLMMMRLSRLFELRHALTHEMPRERPFDFTEFEGLFAASREFIAAVEWVIVEQLYDSVPMTQMGMNTESANKLTERLEDMNEITEKLLVQNVYDIKLLEETQKLWMAFAKSEASLHASLVEGGSMYSMVWASTKSAAVSHRIRELRDLLKSGSAER